MTRREFLVAGLAVGLGPRLALAQQEDFFTGREVLTSLLEKAKANDWRKMPMGQLVGAVGIAMEGTPYVGFTFELFDDREVCAINLKGVDCATFYEAALAIARTIKTGRLTEAEFRKQIIRIRYRGGKLDGYVSRLHYATDYLYDNERKGILNVISDDLPGAILVTQKVSFMSKNPDKYRQLKSNASLVPKIAKTEDEINARRTFFLPTDKVEDGEILLKTGDILAFTTKAEGLDVSHTGICYRDDKDVCRLLHASSVKKQVVLDVRISEYLAKSTKNDGIIVARPLEL